MVVQRQQNQDSVPDSTKFKEAGQQVGRQQSPATSTNSNHDNPPEKVKPLASRRSLRKGWSIGLKATALATIFGVLPVLIVGGVAYRFADKAIAKQIAQEKIAEAELLSDQLGRFLQDRIANANTLSKLVNIIATTGTAGLKTSPEQRQALEDQLTNFYQDYLVFENIVLYDLQGQAIAQSRGSAPEVNQKDFPYFQQALKTGAPVISEPSASDANSLNPLAIYIAAPVKDKAGRTTAVVGGRIPVDFLGNAVLRTASLREGTTYRLIDSSGKIFQSFQDPEAIPLGTRIADKVPLFAEIDAEKQSEAWRDGAANAPLNAYTPISSVVSLNWSLLTSTDAALAFAPQRQLLRTIGLGTILTALVAAVLGAILANRATRPVLLASAAVEKLGGGNLDTRVPVRGNDELAVLGDNINKMADDIQSLLETQRRNVEQLSLQNDVLANLARNEALLQGDATIASRSFTEAVASTLTVDRVTVWLYNSERSKLTCIDQYERTPQHHSQGQEVKASDFLEYFKALEQGRAIIASDTNTDPATSGSASYLMLGIKSRMDIPIQIAGQTAGVLCCEQIESPRQWTLQEQTFASSVANLISLGLESQTLQTEVGHILDVVSTVEDGDLRVRANVSERTTGLVADTLNRLIEELAQVLAQVLGTARLVSLGANNLEQIATTVATNADQQSESVTQVLNKVSQVEQSAQDSSEQIITTNQSLLTLSTAVEEGQAATTTLTQGIEVLQQGTDRIVQQMKTLGEFVGLADQFVQDQSQIASLTQVLSMNAGLVAARAAEQRDPRQFAVVAREFEAIAAQVSKLAQQTDDGLGVLEQRTTQINSVVSAIDADVQRLGGLVSGFNQGVEQSSLVFNNVQKVTKEAVQAGETVTQSASAIVITTRSTALAMRDIAAKAKQTAQLTMETRVQSEAMGDLSTQLLQRIQFFQLPADALQDLESH